VAASGPPGSPAARLSPVATTDLPGFPVLEQSGYRLRLAAGAEDLRRVQALRYQVFNVELGEGFESSHATKLDRDDYDAHAHHLMVEHCSDGACIGTYRVQTPAMAARGAGLYVAQEYDLAPLAELLPRAVEASRACVLRGHREGAPVQLLWKGLARYLAATESRWLFGLCSLTTQDLDVAVRGWLHLRERGVLHPHLRVHPRPEFLCRPAAEIEASDLPPLESMPPLFDAYLRIATRVVGYPAVDRAFRTVDYLSLLDLEEVPSVVRRRFAD